MTTNWRKIGSVGAAALGLALIGCAQGGSTGRGSLKTSVTQLEHDNDILKRQVAELESTKKKVSEQLAQERAVNDDLATRLDNARTLLGQKGTDIPPSRTADADWVDDGSSKVTPSARPGHPARKPPFAQIGGGPKAVIEPDQGEDQSTGSFEPTSNTREELPSQSRREDAVRWLPIATGNDTNVPKG